MSDELKLSNIIPCCDTCVRDPKVNVACYHCIHFRAKRKSLWVIKPSLKKLITRTTK